MPSHNPLRPASLIALLTLPLFIASCATTSTSRTPASLSSYAGPTVQWQGRKYVPLPTLCDSVGVPWEWDRVTRVATVYRGSTAYRFLLDSRIYTTNDLPQLLDAPVVLHRDAVLVPESVAGWWAPPVARPPATVARRPGPMRGAARPPRFTGAPPFRRIVIDAGHGGHDPGTTGFGGTREKDVVLDIARRLERQLEGSGMEVVMTRRRDTFVPLPDRIGLANRRQADLFVSIHANANRNRRISGLEVYYLPESEEDLRRARDQAQAWPWAASSRAALDDTRSLRTVLWDLVNVESRRTSVLMGMHLCRTLQEQLAVRSRGVRGARFVVLRQAMIPAILVEVGYLSNSREEARLASTTYREAIANALAEGIVSFGQAQERRYAWERLAMMRQSPIGVFDSGIGGLTVVKELLRILPREDLIYFGDTARVPYGTKSKATIVKFSLENVEFLLQHNVKLIIIACNTSSAWALPTLKKYFKVPVLGVIRPGAKGAVELTQSRRVGVIGTPSTIRSRAYETELRQLNRGVRVFTQSCPLFVPLVEEGWEEDAVCVAVARRYLQPLLRQRIDTLILGCTHYPLLTRVIQRVVGPRVRLVDSARRVALEARDLLEREELLRTAANGVAHRRFIVTDEPERFKRLGERFLGHRITNVSRCANPLLAAVG